MCVCVSASLSPHSRSTAGQALSAIDQLLIILLCNYYNGNPSPSPCKTLPHLCLQWNLSIKDTMNKGHLSNEGTVCCPNHVELCTNLPLNTGHCSIQDSQLSLNNVLYREVPLYTGQSAGPNGVLYREVPLYNSRHACPSHSSLALPSSPSCHPDLLNLAPSPSLVSVPLNIFDSHQRLM